MWEYNSNITSGDGVLGGGEGALVGELMLAVVKLKLEYDEGDGDAGSGPPAAAGNGIGLGRVTIKSSNKFLGRAALGINADPSDDGTLVGGDGAGLRRLDCWGDEPCGGNGAGLRRPDCGFAREAGSRRRGHTSP